VGSATPLPQGGRAQALQNVWGSLVHVFMHTSFEAELPNLMFNTYGGRGVFLGGQPCLCICTNASRGLSESRVSCLQTGCSACHPTNSIRALREYSD